MKSSYKVYDYVKSFERIDTIINESENSFEEFDEIPCRDKLTFTNGFYVYCTVLYVDIRGSSKLLDKHNRPKLAKLYRSYISEVIAIMNGNINCTEVNIEGDCVWGVFKTPKKVDIDSVFSIAAQISSLVDIMNYKFRKKSIEQITIGMGMDYGRALMIKAGYSGSSINDVVWMGSVVNKASKFCSYGNKSNFDKKIMVSDVIFNNLNDNNKSLLNWNSTRQCYHGDIADRDMDEWYKNNCT
ncbi:class 3 adenylate cyclase [Clostridium pascui]|uniref:adenylate/guanylate cyclase domain-containing protein n=1 Tax=Clostridium pascui TaxID=46609 RepID=UPI001958A8E3|nr:adenylate/guanylate cyclase domain-containing protein [Clostridium pascui]MBM7872022.1 class 3 adenylate cyclase [Clostridium pascui]